MDLFKAINKNKPACLSLYQHVPFYGLQQKYLLPLKEISSLKCIALLFPTHSLQNLRSQFVIQWKFVSNRSLKYLHSYITVF